MTELEQKYYAAAAAAAAAKRAWEDQPGELTWRAYCIAEDAWEQAEEQLWKKERDNWSKMQAARHAAAAAEAARQAAAAGKGEY